MLDRLTQAVKDYGTAAKCSMKVAKHMAQGSSINEINKAAEPFEKVMMDSQRMKDVQKVGMAVGAAMWTGIICAIID